MSEPIVNPVGQAQPLEAIEAYIENLVALWRQENPDVTAPWWKVWEQVATERLQKATKFLLKATDDLIAYVDDKIDNGPDKKATVLNALSRLYDYIIAEALPIWLKPFSKSVKDYIIDSLCSSAIDWIVDKYRNGSWRHRLPSPETAALFTSQGLSSYIPGTSVRPRV